MEEKTMKKTRKIRLLAFILTLCMTLGALPLYVLADEGEEIPEELQDRIVEEVPFAPEYLPAVILGKLAGGISAVAVAILLAKKQK